MCIADWDCPRMLIFFVKQIVFHGDLKMPSLEVSMQSHEFFEELICVIELRILCYSVSFWSLCLQSEMQVEQFAIGVLLQRWLFSN